MIRYLFAAILALHGSIHVLAFVKAFHLANVPSLPNNFSKVQGITWLITAFTFLTALTIFLLSKTDWWIPVAVALIVSQALIVQRWDHAKAGTLPNVIILIAAILAFANWSFNQKVTSEIQHLLPNNIVTNRDVVTWHMLQHLPEPVKKWLVSSGIVGNDIVRTVYLKQKGWMRTSAKTTKWIAASAEQYFTVDEPGFIWTVQMNMMPFLPVVGEDKYVNGRGQMVIKALSLFDVVNENGDKVDQGTLQRYLAEICWFPSAALSRYITWQAIDNNYAKATMHYNGVSGSVTFQFSNEGDVVACTADRYMGGGKDAMLEKWVVTSEKFAVMNGIKIPVKSEATWKLKSGDFTWYKLEITSVAYNRSFNNR